MPQEKGLYFLLLESNGALLRIWAMFLISGELDKENDE